MTDASSTLETAIRAARILILDDVAANVELLTEALQGDGYVNVVGTTDPREGLDLIDAGHCDLIVLDLRMPEMDGYEVIRQLKNRHPGEHLPVLVLTAQTDSATRERALACGVRDFLTKPVVLWEFLHRVRNVLELEVQFHQIQQLNATLESRVRARTHELEQTRKEVIERLATTGEFRDNETGRHVIRISQYAYHLALAAGIAEPEAAMIRDAAPLHDIGKIGIPDAILLNPGRLDPDELEIMRSHTTIGGEILAHSGFPLLDLARSIALTHHEHWDGTGYPAGLRGEAIPLAGRIVAIADVFDAITSERRYKPAWLVDRAVAFIRGLAGRQFDPRLVDLFVRELPAIIDIKRRFEDRPAVQKLRAEPLPRPPLVRSA
jgi:putative two-component system response regulator